MFMPFSPDVKVQQSQREQMAVMRFLAALPSEYDSAKAQICPILRYHLSRRPLAGFFTLRYHPLLHLPLYLPRQAVLLLDRPLERQRNRNSGPGDNTRGPGSGGVVCYYCHKSGHVIRDCKK